MSTVEVFDNVIYFANAPQILKYNTYSQGLRHSYFPNSDNYGSKFYKL